MSSDPIGGPLLLQVILIAINAYFASTEIAVLSLNDVKIRRQAEEGDRVAKLLMKLAENPNRFLSTIQVGITLAGFLGSAFAAENFASVLAGAILAAGVTVDPQLLNTLCVIVITLILSYFTLVLGELVPKRLAMQKTEEVARFTCGVVSFLSAVMRPLIWLLTVSTHGMLRLLHIDPNAKEDEVSEEEIRMMMDIGEEKGAIESGEKEMIDNIFEFNNMTAEEVMIHRTDVVMLWAQDSDEEIIRTIRETGLTRFPVYEEDADDVIGILNTRTYLLNAREAQPKPLRELLTPAYFVPESVRADKLFRDMQSRKVHLAIVIDEYGGTAGLVTMEDILEELVGEIWDEHDEVIEEITQIGENAYKVLGTTPLDKIFKLFDIEDEETDSATLSGWTAEQFDRIPVHGEDFIYANLKVEVLKSDTKKVDLVKITVLEAQQTA